jgi:hypothetical protein
MNYGEIMQVRENLSHVNIEHQVSIAKPVGLTNRSRQAAPS